MTCASSEPAAIPPDEPSRNLPALLSARGIQGPQILAAFARVPRSRFLEPVYRELAGSDLPLPLPYGQISSSPYVLARVLRALDVRPSQRVLEIGVGSGYLTALLLELGASVLGIERSLPLVEAAAERLHALGRAPDSFELRTGDGSFGAPDRAPFDRIVVSAAVDHLPADVLAQLSPDGILVVPLGSSRDQRLLAIRRTGTTLERTDVMGAVFSPLLGAAGLPEPGLPTPPRRRPN